MLQRRKPFITTFFSFVSKYSHGTPYIVDIMPKIVLVPSLYILELELMQVCYLCLNE